MQSAILVGHRTSGEWRPGSTDPPLASSAPIGLDGFVFEHHRLRAEELNDGELRHPLVFVQLSEPADLEWLSDGRWRTTTTHPGSIGVTPAGAPLTYRWEGELDLLLFSIDFAECRRKLPDIWPSGEVQVRRRLNVEDAQLVHLAHAFRTEAEAGCPAGRIYGESLSAAFAASVLARYAEPAPEAHPGGLPPAQLRPVLDYIETRLDGALSLQELAGVAHISPFHFGRLFKQSTGVTPHQYVLRRRIGKAKQLLRDPALSIAEVAYATGFPSQAHFTTVFGRITGVTPKAFRNGR